MSKEELRKILAGTIGYALAPIELDNLTGLVHELLVESEEKAYSRGINDCFILVGNLKHMDELSHTPSTSDIGKE